MKKSILTIATAAIMMSAGVQATGHAAEPESALKVKVTNLRSTTGNVLVALGDYTKPMEMAAAMAPATGEAVECVINGKIDLGANLNVFHDANGNFNLDLNEAGTPVEGCYSSPVTLDENGVAVVELRYYAE